MLGRSVLSAAVLLGAACTADAGPIDVASWASGLPDSYRISGDKNEPTYLVAIDIERQGDVFTITGGAPAWAERSVEAIEILSDGTLRHRVCPKAMRCDDGSVPSGFLATTALLSTLRAGRSLGEAQPVPYGERSVICIPAERIGIAEPILDPCFDTQTGAVLAQRHRLSGQFDGPSLDPWSIRVLQATAEP
jgi:hypothetical protein